MDQDRVDTHRALEKAHEAFEKYLTKKGYDCSYFAARFTTWLLSTNEFKPLEKIELDTRGETDGEYHE